MNTKGLAKHYDTLTPRERFPLIIAAAARGDDLERERLVSSAPRVTYSMPDYWRLAKRFEFFAHFMFMKVLDLAACYLESFGLSDEDEKTAQGREAMESTLMLGYLFQVHRVGWHRFCAELGVDPEHHWRRLPGMETVRGAAETSGTDPDRLLPGAAFTEEEAARYLARLAARGRDAAADEAVKQIRVPTAGAITAALRIVWEEPLGERG